ncbi:hypothetical protein GCM10023187_25030 [Nibrella viscosa]|uniref:Class I SAM-dependent methyltransferase n=1 Tax=Nibrella viscosa TaxID=1084524 RepID=A0ABP8KGB4_9BACT
MNSALNMPELPEVLKNMYKTGQTRDISGRNFKFHSGVTEEEAILLMKIITDLNAQITLETGLACGASALAICAAAIRNSSGSIHYAIDPNQNSDWCGSALASIDEAGYNKNFKLLEGKTHEMFHILLNNSIKLDFAFIDGWHTFDYTLVDFFFIDKILRLGGIVAFHDMNGLAKQKVLRFILTHRNYEVENEYRLYDKDRAKIWRYFLFRLYKQPRLLFSWYHWVYQTKTASGLIVLRKKSNYEPDYSFYKPF